MGAIRKLQAEIDRLLKKVKEGVDEFDSIWDKVHEIDNAKKFEDLRKEVKKLRRYRDQITTWQQSSEIKEKRVGASYEEALTDARMLIESEVERYKVCEKEMKTKAFSIVGLGQQPKTDPKEEAKSETRDWLNNVVGDLENEIDIFEAELEGTSGKKGKRKNPRLTRLETSISRHKAHVMKLELIIRLLDNDELCPDQVNDLKYYLEEYKERNQVEFKRFNNINELYASLPLDKMEALEDTLGTTGFVKAARVTPTKRYADQDRIGEATSEKSNPRIIPNTPPTVTAAGGPLLSSLAASVPWTPQGPSSELSAVSSGSSSAALSKFFACTSSSVREEEDHSISDCRSSSVIHETERERGIGGGRSNQEPVSTPMSSSMVGGISSSKAFCSVSESASSRNLSSVDERAWADVVSCTPPNHLSGRILPQQVSKINDGIISNDVCNASEGLTVGGRIFSPSVSISEWGTQNAAAFQNQNEVRGRPVILPDHKEKFLQRLQQVQQSHGALLGLPPLPLVNHQQFPVEQENSMIQQILSSEQQNPVHQQSCQIPLTTTGPKDVDIGDSKGKDLQQHTQQHISSDIMNVESTTVDNLKTPHKATGTTTKGKQLLRHIDFSPGHPLPSSQPSAFHGLVDRRSGPDLGAIGDNLSGSSGKIDQPHTLQLLEAVFRHLPQPSDSERSTRYFPQQNPLHQQSCQIPLTTTGPKDVDIGHSKGKDLQQHTQQHISSDIMNVESTTVENLMTPHKATGTTTKGKQLLRHIDFSPGHPLPSSQPSAFHGVVDRRSGPDLGAIGDNLSGSSGKIDQPHTLQLLEAALRHLPQPRDFERSTRYIPQQNPLHQQSCQIPLTTTGPKDVDIGHSKGKDLQQHTQQHISSDIMNVESTTVENLMTPHKATGTTTKGKQLLRHIDFSPGHPLPSSQPSAFHGVVDQRSGPDLGAIGDNLSGSFGKIDQLHTWQLLEAVLRQLPQPRDSERSARYIPQQNPVHQQSCQIPLTTTGPKDVDIGHSKGKDLQQHTQQHISSDIMNVESTTVENLMTPHKVTGTTNKGKQLLRHIDFSPGHPLPFSQPSTSHGVVDRRSVPDIGVIGDNLSGSSGKIDQPHTLQLLEAALRQLPQPRDSERSARYIPCHPAATPPSFPQAQAAIVRNPAFWKKMAFNNPPYFETLFFAFYYQQNTFQQYMAARELKDQLWKFNKKFNTWFLYQSEPKVKTDEYEIGAYVYYYYLDDAKGWRLIFIDDFLFEHKDEEREFVDTVQNMKL